MDYTVCKSPRRWIKDIPFVIVADSAFATHTIAHACKKFNGALVSRMRLDARIFNFPNQNKKRKERALLVAKRCPLFTDYLTDSTIAWEKIGVNWYGGKEKNSMVCIWNSSSSDSMGIN